MSSNWVLFSMASLLGKQGSGEQQDRGTTGQGNNRIVREALEKESMVYVREAQGCCLEFLGMGCVYTLQNKCIISELALDLIGRYKGLVGHSVPCKIWSAKWWGK